MQSHIKVLFLSNTTLFTLENDICLFSLFALVTLFLVIKKQVFFFQLQLQDIVYHEREGMIHVYKAAFPLPRRISSAMSALFCSTEPQVQTMIPHQDMPFHLNFSTSNVYCWYAQRFLFQMFLEPSNLTVLTNLLSIQGTISVRSKY